jgi:beta-galactosidase
MEQGKPIVRLISTVLASAIGLFGAADAGQIVDFNGGWRFLKGDATNAQAPSFSDGSWTSVQLPHTVQVEPTLGPKYYVGPCWYRKSFTPDASYQGRKVRLQFGAAMQTAQVWINGTLKITHLGGYTPFTVDITNDLVYGSTNVVAARLDNTYSPNFGPGIQYPDFDYFGGLYRPVFLDVSNPVHITDPILEEIPAGGGVFVTYPSVSTASATVQVKTHVRNESTAGSSVTVTSTFHSPSGSVAGSASSTQTIAAGATYSFAQSILVGNPQLWSPDAPNLYDLQTQVSSGGTVTDTQSNEIGIRTIKFDRTGFAINGKHVRIRGADRHQDYPYVGNAVPASGQYRDALRLKEAGFNFVRMSHYVNSIEFVKACDKLGILGMACIPGWHSPSGATFWANSYIDIQKMVRDYRNHPSVVLWEVVHNESQGSDGNTTYPTTANATAQAEYPGGQLYTAGENTSADIGVWTPTEQSGARTEGAPSSRPVMMSEYGDWNYGGDSSTSRVLRSDGEAAMLVQVANQQNSLNQNMALGWLSGDALWSYDDYQTMLHGTATIIESGVVDLFRIPKFSFYFYQSQRDPAIVVPGVSSGPMVHIASFWNANSTPTIHVYSNCAQVRLSLNGSVVATQSPDAGKNFTHSPFTFTGIKSFQAGTLVAQGLIGGSVVAADTVKTPGTPAAMKVVWDTAGMSLLADGSDMAIVNAEVLDANGTTIPTAANSVTFSITGGSGQWIGNNPTNAVAGVASILLKTSTAAGPIKVTATSSGLTAGSAIANAKTGAATGIVLEDRRASAAPPALRMAVIRNQLRLSLNGPDVPTGRTLFIADAAGHVVLSSPCSGPEMAVDLTGIPRGVYLVSIGSGASHRQGKFFRD